MVQSQQPQPSRPSPLSRIQRGTVESPPRILVFGPPGVGKSTIACSAPNPIVIQGEEGTKRISTSRFPRPESWADVREQVQSLLDDPHDYQTVIHDTLDGLEPMVLAEVCAEAKVDTIEKAWGGYGKGFTRALDKWREHLALLERLITRRGMAVVFTAHSVVKTFHNPEGADFDRYIPKMNEKAWGVFFEWCDAVLFAQYETATTGDPDEKGKAFSTGVRMLRTVRKAAWEAKNRYGFPESMVMPAEDGWSVLAAHFDAPKLIRAEIETLLAAAHPELSGAVRTWLGRAPDDATLLREGLERLKARLAPPPTAN